MKFALGQMKFIFRCKRCCFVNMNVVPSVRVKCNNPPFMNLCLYINLSKGELPTRGKREFYCPSDSSFFKPAVDESLKLYRTFPKAESPTRG